MGRQFFYKKIRKALKNWFSMLFTFPSGFEPLAFRLGGERSILLSYGNIYSKAVRHEQLTNTVFTPEEN